MHKYHEQAERLVRDVMANLEAFLPHDGEDISCWNPSAVDESIRSLILVRTLLACANEALGYNENEPANKPDRAITCGCDGYYQLFGVHRPGCPHAFDE